MLAGLDDPYSTYYTAEEYESFVADMNGPEEYAGIGAGVTKDTTTGLVNVTKVYKGTPAEEAGLRDGDVIYMVDDIDVTDMDLDLLVNEHVRGEAGTDVTLTIQRAGESELMEITITRRAVTLKTVEHEMLEGNIGYIAVTSFDVVTVDEFKAAVDELETAGMEKLVIDLRGNVGGLVDSAVEMLDYMLPDGLLVYTADRYGQGTKYNGSDGHEVDVPTAILINENSASASELFAGAYKDYDKATIVGNTSFGKGIVQVTVPLGDGSAIKITTEHYYTPSGFDLHGKGIEPDIEVDLDVGVITGSEQDNQLAAAIEALGE
jgi:carboxyl-terminal processing protease